MFSNHFYLAPEVLFSSQGAKERENVLKLDYLQIPVMARYYFSNGLNIEAGPQIQFLLNTSGNLQEVRIASKEQYENVELSIAFGLIPVTKRHFLKRKIHYSFSFDGETETGKEDIKDYVKTKDFALAAGLGYKFYGGLFANARYILRLLSNISKEDQGIDAVFDEDFNSDAKIRNRVFKISMGFMF